MKDPYGQPLSTSDVRVEAAIADFIEGFLSNETRVTHILNIADSEDQCALAQAYSAALMLMGESHDAAEMARPFMEKAKAMASTATEREQWVIAAVDAWYCDDIPRALRLGEELADRFPRELAMAKITQNHYFNFGNPAGMLRIAEKVAPTHPTDPHVHGMLAFGYEQCHLLAEAEMAAQKALELKEKEPWAQHALAHVYLTRGQTDTGIRFLEEVSVTWQDLNSFMYTHNWWHLCLFYLNRDRFGDVLKCFDTHLWGISPEFSQDQIGAVSMLMRLEHHAVDVGQRWLAVGEYLKTRVRDHVNPFLDLQYIYGLSRAGMAEADEMFEQLERYAVQAPEHEQSRWVDIALPAARGLMAHARGQWRRTSEILEEILPRMHHLGGSHAQRALFEMVLLDARIKAGDWVNAQQSLEILRQYDDRVPHTWRLLAQAYTALELPQEVARTQAALAGLVENRERNAEC